MTRASSRLSAALNDRYRLERELGQGAGGKVVEHWDVLQPIPERSANDNSIF